MTFTCNTQTSFEPLPLIHKLRNMQFPNDLKNIEEVIDIHKDLLTINAPGTLAQCLEKEAVFGEDIMKMCTPTGSKQHKALPQRELLLIKTTIFKQYPQYRNDPRGFEDKIWIKCQTAIEQACGRLRRKK